MRLLSICPRIHKEGATIVATTALGIRILLLWALYRQVKVDPVLRRITIYKSYAWVFRFRRQIDFSEVQAVTYGYEDTSYEASYAAAHESHDRFTVGLRLKDDTELVLHRFSGDGTLVNNTPLPNGCLNPFGWEFEGSQERDSRDYVEVVANLVEVTTIPHRGF